MNYLYVIHSRHYDIDGVDRLYKLGCTNDIARRKFDGCYTTAFRYECTYKCYWELKDKGCHHVEAGIKSILKDKGHRSDTYKGTEMYSISLKALISTVEGYLRKIGCNYMRYDGDPFHTKPVHTKTMEVDDLMRRDLADIQPGKQLDKYLHNVWECPFWEKEPTTMVEHRCYDCNRPLCKTVIVFDHPSGLRYCGSECAKKHISDTYLRSRKEYAVGRANRFSDKDIRSILTSGRDKNLLLDHNPYAKDMYDALSGSITREKYGKRLKHLGRTCGVQYAISFYRAEALAHYVYGYSKNYTIDEFRRAIDTQSEASIPGCKIYDVFRYGVSCKAITSFIIENNEVHSLRYRNAAKNIIDWVVAHRAMPLDIGKAYKMRELTIKDDASGTLFSFNGVLTGSDEQLTQIKDHNSIVELIRRGIGIITGGPGSGKSTFIAYGLSPFLQSNDYYVHCMSPTAIAAKRLCDKIIGSGQVKLALNTEGTKHLHGERMIYTIHGAIKRPHNPKSPLKIAYIIDEISMLNVLLLSDFLESIAPDSIVIFAGDVRQLPPIGGGSVYDILKDRIPIVELEGNNRVNDIRLKCMFDNSCNNMFPINDLLAPTGPLAAGELGCSYTYKSASSGIACIVREMLNTWGVTHANEFNNKYDTKVFLAHKRAIVADINNEVRKALGLTGVFAIGDRVIITKNNHKKDYYNGEMGTVMNVLSDGCIQITIDTHEHPVFVEGEDLGNIMHAYAMTIHKAQGGGYNRVCYVRNEWSNKTSATDYTAITRVRNHLHLFDANAPEASVITPTEREKAPPSSRRAELIQLITRYLTIGTHWEYRDVFNSARGSLQFDFKLMPDQASCLEKALKRRYYDFAKHHTHNLIREHTTYPR